MEIKKIKSSKNEKLLENLKGDRVWYIRPMGMELKIDQFRAFMEEMASFDEKLRVCIIDDAQKWTNTRRIPSWKPWKNR